MATITGRLQTITSGEAEAGSIVIALCGYGQQIPAQYAEGVFARVTTPEINAGSDGTFTTAVTGNDNIHPPGTYYTITVKDSNGDVVQTNAYLFLGEEEYTLENTLPFDPSLPMMPIPPLLFDELLPVTATDTMDFDGSAYTAFKTVLHSDVTHATFTNMVPGNLYTFIILQDSTGGWEFHWSSTVHNGTMVMHDPDAQTVQTFVADTDGQLYAISGGAYS